MLGSMPHADVDGADIAEQLKEAFALAKKLPIGTVFQDAVGTVTYTLARCLRLGEVGRPSTPFTKDAVALYNAELRTYLHKGSRHLAGKLFTDVFTKLPNLGSNLCATLVDCASTATSQFRRAEAFGMLVTAAKHSVPDMDVSADKVFAVVQKTLAAVVAAATPSDAPLKASRARSAAAAAGGVAGCWWPRGAGVLACRDGVAAHHDLEPRCVEDVRGVCAGG